MFIFPALLLWKLDSRPATDDGAYLYNDEAPLPKRPWRLRVRLCGERVPAASLLYLFSALFVCVSYVSTLLIERFSDGSSSGA